MESVTPKQAGPVRVGKDRLDSWKAIAAHLDRDVRTAKRWEREWGLPVHRLPGGPKAGVFAFRSELDAWRDAKRVEAAEPLAAAPTSSPARWQRRLWVILAAAGVVLVIAGLALALAVRRIPKLLMLAESRYTPFATALPLQACPAWSPDGTTIAFVGGLPGQLRIMTQTVGGSPAVAVTGPEVVLTGGADVWCRRPFWSPDSQAIYFLGGQSGVFGVYRVAASGGAASLVQRGVVAASISRDGSALVFLARDGAVFRIWIASPPEGPRRPYEPAPFRHAGFSNIPEVMFSPDGRVVLVGITADGDNEFWRLPWPEGKPERLFTRGERSVGSPRGAWMPDSRHLVFSAGFPLAIGDIRSGRYWPIAMQDHPMQAPTPSPDGSRIAYQSMLSHADVVAVPLGSGEPETLLGSSLSEMMPAVSPSTAQMVYVTDRRPRGVWVRSLDGAWDRPLIQPSEVKARGEGAQMLMVPTFSPDGGRIAFAAVSPAGPAVFTASASGGPAVAIGPRDDAGRAAPTWSPDGQWLAFRQHRQGTIRLAKARIGSAEPPIDLAATCGQTMPEWSPSGEWIAFPDENCRLAIIRPDGTGKRALGGSGAVAWSRDSRTIYRVDPELRAIVAVDVDAGRDRIIRAVGDLLPYSLPQPGLRVSLTPDGKRLVYSVLRPREEIWILEGVDIREPWYARLLALIGR